MLISSSSLQSSPPRECSPPDQELPGLVQALLHPLPLLEGLPAPLCHVQQVWQALLLATLKVQQGVEEILPEWTLGKASTCGFWSDKRKIICHLKDNTQSSQNKSDKCAIIDDLPASSWFEISWLPSSCALRLFHLQVQSTWWHGTEQTRYLEIFPDEKAINSGGDAKVVNVMTPRTTLAHLDAPKSRSRDLVGEDSVLGNLKKKIVQYSSW